VELDPNWVLAHAFYGWYLVWMGRYDAGIAENKRAVELDPLSSMNNEMLGQSLYFARRYDQAIEHMDQTLYINPHDWWALALRGFSYERKGQLSEAIADLRKASAQSIPWSLGELARAYAALGKQMGSSNRAWGVGGAMEEQACRDLQHRHRLRSPRPERSSVRVAREGL
jgi:tetratricopeptide (TPR) repeat protein